MIEQTYLHYYLVDGELVERRFRSSILWPENGKLYALASDPVAIERCRAEALKLRKGITADLDAAHRIWFENAQPWTSDKKVEEPAPPPRPSARFTVPGRGKPMIPPPRRNP